MHGEMEKGLELGTRGTEFRPSSTTSQLCDFGQVTASLSLSFIMYKIGLIMILIIIANIHYVLTTILSILCILPHLIIPDSQVAVKT